MKNLLTFCFFFFLSEFCAGDVPTFDVFVFDNGEEQLYLRMSGIGEFKPDLCYYDHEGKFLISAKDMVRKHRGRKNLPVFETLVIFNFSTVNEYKSHNSHRQVHLKNRQRIHADSLLSEYNLIRIIEGETYGSKRTKELSSQDKTWIEQNKLEVLFSIYDGGMCELDFISIAGVYSTQEKAEIKSMVSECINNEEVFIRLLSNLYKSSIIMNGFCSC